jgi:hypothetical protein
MAALARPYPRTFPVCRFGDRLIGDRADGSSQVTTKGVPIVIPRENRQRRALLREFAPIYSYL